MSKHDLVLSVRSANLMKRIGAATIRDLVLFTEDEILSGMCFGETTLREIREQLARRGLRLGMSPSELRGRSGLDGKLIRDTPTTPPVATKEPEHEGACCGHCEAAAETLRQQAAARISAGETVLDEVQERKLRMSLAELELPVRVTNCLETEGLTTVRDLVIRSAEELLEIRNFQESMLQVVKSKLAAHGLALEA
jgi:DNA-directed RNA polymerase alpha subunit